MTEKRFRVTISNTNTVYFVDFIENKQLMSITFKDKSDAIDCKNALMYQCGLLNDLHEENIKMKKDFNSCSHNWALMYDEAKDKVEELSEENEQLKQVLGNILLEVKRDITNTNVTGEVKTFINPNSYELISEVLRKYGALKEWYE